MVVISASLQNHDGPGGNTVNRGIWAKIYNIQSKTWLTTSPFNVNQVSAGDQNKSATLALTGLKFLIAFYTDPGFVKTRMWTPSSGSDVSSNAWTVGDEEVVNSYTSNDQRNLRWLKMPKESKALLTWDQWTTSGGNGNKIYGQFYDLNTGAKIGSNFILLAR